MAQITPAELTFRYSTKVGSGGNQNAGNASGSLGTWVSQTLWTGNSPNDLFDDISGQENENRVVDYRCVFLHNTNTANPLTNTVVYIGAETGGGADIAIAVDTTPASALTAGTPQALTAATETAPGGTVTALNYSTPTNITAGLPMGTIGIGQVKAVWIRRTTTNSAALSVDGFELRIYGDSGDL